MDLYDATGRLLLKRGHLIEGEAQLERLLEQGMCDPTALQAAGARHAAQRHTRVIHEFSKLPSQLMRNRVSVFGRLNAAAEYLDELFDSEHPHSGLEAAVRAIAANVRECCALDSDASLAQIMLSDHDTYSRRHAINAAILVTLVLNRLHEAPERIDSIVAAALTMNLSIHALQNTLYRQQEALRPEQRAMLQSHPSDAAQRLRAEGVTDEVWLRVVEQHHEAIDGSGYPLGLKGAALCQEAQIVALADRYCTLVSERAHRPAMAPRRAIKELHERTAHAADGASIRALIATLGLFPPGSYVRLANGETAIVGHRLLDPKHPVVYALHQDTSVPYEAPKKRLTSSNPSYEIVADVNPQTLRVKIDPDVLWPPTATGLPDEVSGHQTGDSYVA